MSDVLTVVYPGLSEKVWKAQLAMVENVSDLDDKFYPREPKKEFFYYPKKLDSNAELARKAARRKKYRDMRKKEVISGLEDVDAVLEVCGLVLPKDKPVKANLSKMQPGEVEKLHNMLQQKLLLHVDDWKAKSEAAAEKPKVKPEVKPVQQKKA